MTKGGEALEGQADNDSSRASWDRDPPAQADHSPQPMELAEAQWYALYTKSHCEQLVYDQLEAKGLHLFLPCMDVWSRRSGIRHRIPAPMFPSYLFLYHAMDKMSFLEVRKARGLVRILGERWDRLSIVPENDIATIQGLYKQSCPSYPISISVRGNEHVLPMGRWPEWKEFSSIPNPPRACWCFRSISCAAALRWRSM